MKLEADDFDRELERPASSACARFARGLAHMLGALWRFVAFVLYLSLGMLEVFIGPMLVGLAMMIGLTAVVLRYGFVLPHFPFWGLIGAAVGCLVLMVLYQALLQLLRRQSLPSRDRYR